MKELPKNDWVILVVYASGHVELFGHEEPTLEFTMQEAKLAQEKFPEHKFFYAHKA